MVDKQESRSLILASAVLFAGLALQTVWERMLFWESRAESPALRQPMPTIVRRLEAEGVQYVQWSNGSVTVDAEKQREFWLRALAAQQVLREETKK